MNPLEVALGIKTEEEAVKSFDWLKHIILNENPKLDLHYAAKAAYSALRNYAKVTDPQNASLSWYKKLYIKSNVAIREEARAAANDFFMPYLDGISRSPYENTVEDQYSNLIGHRPLDFKPFDPPQLVDQKADCLPEDIKPEDVVCVLLRNNTFRIRKAKTIRWHAAALDAKDGNRVDLDVKSYQKLIPLDLPKHAEKFKFDKSLYFWDQVNSENFRAIGAMYSDKLKEDRNLIVDILIAEKDPAEIGGAAAKNTLYVMTKLLRQVLFDGEFFPPFRRDCCTIIGVRPHFQDAFTVNSCSYDHPIDEQGFFIRDKDSLEPYREHSKDYPAGVQAADIVYYKVGRGISEEIKSGVILPQCNKREAGGLMWERRDARGAQGGHDDTILRWKAIKRCTLIKTDSNTFGKRT